MVSYTIANTVQYYIVFIISMLNNFGKSMCASVKKEQNIIIPVIFQ